VHVDFDGHQLAVDWPELDRQHCVVAVDFDIDRSVVGQQLDFFVVHVDFDGH
ncbi:hypothetical protein BSLA_01r4984, partial [Burkholderia stabilis]